MLPLSKVLLPPWNLPRIQKFSPTALMRLQLSLNPSQSATWLMTAWVRLQRKSGPPAADAPSTQVGVSTTPDPTTVASPLIAPKVEFSPDFGSPNQSVYSSLKLK